MSTTSPSALSFFSLSSCSSLLAAADQQPRRGIEINLMADSEDSDDIAMDDSDGDQQQASFRTFLHKQKPSRQDSEHNMDD